MELKNVLTHEEFHTFAQKVLPDPLARSPFALRAGEHFVTIPSTRPKHTSLAEAEFLISVNVFDNLSFEILKGVAHLVICTMTQLETYLRAEGVDESSLTRSNIKSHVTKLHYYHFLKILRFRCDECANMSGMIFSLEVNGRKTLFAKYNIRSTVIPFLSDSTETYKTKKILAANQAAQLSFPANTPYSIGKDLIRNTQDENSKGIKPHAIVANHILIESVRTEENWMIKLQAKMRFYAELLSTPDEYLSFNFNEKPILILVAETLAQAYEIEDLFCNGILLLSGCEVYLTTDLLSFIGRENCALLKIETPQMQIQETVTVEKPDSRFIRLSKFLKFLRSAS